MSSVRIRAIAMTIPLLFIWGCAAFSTSPPPSYPYFEVEPADIKTLTALGTKQEALASREPYWGCTKVVRQRGNFLIR